MKVTRTQLNAALAVAFLSVLSVSTSFAQEAKPLTKEELRSGFKAGMQQVRQNFLDCLANIPKTPEVAVQPENTSPTAEVTDPEINPNIDPERALCIETAKQERSDLLALYKGLREQFRAQAKADREAAAVARKEAHAAAAAERQQAVEEKKAAAADKKAVAEEKKAAAEEKKAAAKARSGR